MAKNIKKNNKSVKKNVYLNGGLTSSLVETTENTFPSVTSNSSLMSEWANYRPTSNIKNVNNTGELVGGALLGGLSGAAAGTAVLPGIGTAIGAAVGLAGSLFGGLSKNNKLRKEIAKANKKILSDNAYAEASFLNNINNSSALLNLTMQSNYFQDGGPLHSLGAEFPNGVSHIREGGSHTDNPMGGVLVGVGENGLPNLLEEGEVKFNNYVFSNSLSPSKDLLLSVNIKDSFEGKTFAEIAASLSKESNERPNDPISKTGLYSSMAKLTIAQEAYKEEEGLNESPYQANLFEEGGGLDPDPEEAATGGGSLSSLMRFAPVIGSAISLGQDIFGSLNLPDYTHANSVKPQSVNFNPIGNYMTYNPLDTNYYSNQLRGASAATRSAITNQSGGNRATATAGILAADNNAIGHLGALNRQAEEQNLAQRMQVELFNNLINQFNSEGLLRADLFNAENAYQSSFHQAQMKDRVDESISRARSAHLTNMFDNLGEVGREAILREMINSNPAWRYGTSGTGKVANKEAEKAKADKKKKDKDDKKNKKEGK